MAQINSSSSQNIINNFRKDYLDFPLLIDYNNSYENNIKQLNLNDGVKRSEPNYKEINKTNYLNNDKENILTIPEKCRRCRTKQPEIMCKECYPFIYFCSNCSKSLHSMLTKRNHNLIPLKELNQEIFNEFNSNNFCLNSNSPSLTNNKFTLNYINDIKNLYETEKNNFVKKSVSLEKNLENTKQAYDDIISELNEKLVNLQNSRNVELKILEETKNYELNNLLKDKQKKIDILVNRNDELNKFNEDLRKQISEYKDYINKSKIKNKDIIQNLKEEIEKLKQEKDELKKFYEKKLNSMNNAFNEEKNNLIQSYEEQIKKINMDYNKNKEKMKSLILQRERDINEIIIKHKNTINEMTKETDNYKNKSKLKNQEYDELINSLKEKENEIDELKYLLNNENQKYINECNDKMILEKKVDELSKVIEDIKGKNIYLNRLTHGKLNK